MSPACTLHPAPCTLHSIYKGQVFATANSDSTSLPSWIAGSTLRNESSMNVHIHRRKKRTCKALGICCPTVLCPTARVWKRGDHYPTVSLGTGSTCCSTCNSRTPSHRCMPCTRLVPVMSWRPGSTCCNTSAIHGQSHCCTICRHPALSTD
jgi:hypothetical protein